MQIQRMQPLIIKSPISQLEQTNRINSPKITSKNSKINQSISMNRQGERELKLSSAYKTIGMGNFVNLRA